MDMDFFDVSFEESLDEQLVNAILDVGRDIRRFFVKGEPESNFNDFEASESCDSEDVNTDLTYSAGVGQRDSEEDGKGWLNYQGTE